MPFFKFYKLTKGVTYYWYTPPAMYDGRWTQIKEMYNNIMEIIGKKRAQEGPGPLDNENSQCTAYLHTFWRVKI